MKVFWGRLGVFALACQPLLAQTTYTVRDLGGLTDLSGRSDSGPVGINRLGNVVGSNVTNGTYRAMVYTGSWQQLGTLGGPESLAGAINDSGWVVGSADTSAGSTNAFAWNLSNTNGVASNPRMMNLGTLGGPVSEAFDINRAGQITGYSDVPAAPMSQQHAFVYSGGTMKDIGALLPQFPNSFGYAINATGHVTGAAYDLNYTAPRVFFFDGTTASDLGTFGSAAATALALNDSDALAGYLTSPSNLDTAFSYGGGKLTKLGTLGGDYSYAHGINNSNLVVGGSFVDKKNQVYHAFVYEGGSMGDLNLMLDGTGAGWTLTEARAVNDDGQITGLGLFGGSPHTFLLTPVSSNTNAPPPELTIFLGSSSQVVLEFASVAGAHYTVQTNSSASNAGWGISGPVLTGTGGTLSVTNSTGKSVSLFYRAEVSGP
jgi:probable HAF family extracellular repeat protein